MTTKPPAPPTQGTPWTYLFLTLSIVLSALATWALFRVDGVTREAALMGGIFVLAAILWVTEAMPLFATSLLVIGLEIILLANPGGWTGLGFESGDSPGYRTIIHGAADPILLLFFGGFLLAQAAVKHGVDKALSALFLRPFGKRPVNILLGLMVITAIFSMWMSNTATTAMMITLVAPLAAQLPKDERFRVALFLSVPFAANIGGVGTPIGSPPNAVAAGFLLKAGYSISFLQWMLVAVPIMVVVILFAWQLLWRTYRPRASDFAMEPPTLELTRKSYFVVFIFATTVLLWLTDRLHGLPSAVVALVPAIAFTASGLLNRDDLNKIEWNVLILIAGGIALGAGIQLTGLDQVIVNALPVSADAVGWLLVTLVVAIIVLSTFMSNTAAANLLLPIAISATASMGAQADSLTVQTALSLAFAASMAMALPISTPPNAIAYASGGFTTRDLARNGLIIGALAAALVLLAGGTLMRIFGVID